MKTSLKQKIAISVFWIVLVTSFLFFATLLNLKANGWVLNTQTWRLFKTGMISLNGNPPTAKIEVNGKFRNDYLPYKIAKLAPGNYEVTISSPNYKTWQKNIRVEEGQASIYENVKLFFTNPTDVSVPQDVTVDLVKSNSSNRQSDVRVSGGEIYYRNNLVSRFSSNVATAVLYPDEYHIIYQINDEIRVIELDGGNNQLLFRLNSTEPTWFSFQNNSRTIHYLDQGKVLGKVIR